MGYAYICGIIMWNYNENKICENTKLLSHKCGTQYRNNMEQKSESENPGRLAIRNRCENNSVALPKKPPQC